MYDIRKLLLSTGIRPSDKLSQNFLIDSNIVEAEIGFADLRNDDVVLDIGSGFGFLAEQASKKARKVIAVELDRRLAPYLRRHFEKNKNVEVVEGDILDVVKNLEFDKVVANIPYSISSQITFSLFDKNFELAVICYQKEFAQRMVAKPGSGDYSRLSVMTNYFADADILMTVPKKSFYPQPDVDSGIVMIKPKKEKPYKVGDEKSFFKIVSVLFQHKKQTVRNALVHSSKTLGLGKKEIKNIGLGSLESRRVFTLSGKEIAAVSEEVKKYAQRN
ncbi:MAG: ribosomal RNA small subunit methyltransferase A [Candidatus Aenigmarchaeota archaeon]|nr:ribosomal RNA small subunit methyltransferase A [Candidatus Aenigmarchaeota archaeon]